MSEPDWDVPTANEGDSRDLVDILDQMSAGRILEQERRNRLFARMRIEGKDGTLLGEANLEEDDCEIVRRCASIDQFRANWAGPLTTVGAPEIIFRIGGRSWLTTKMRVADEDGGVTYTACEAQPYNSNTDVILRTISGHSVVVQRGR